MPRYRISNYHKWYCEGIIFLTQGIRNGISWSRRVFFITVEAEISGEKLNALPRVLPFLSLSPIPKWSKLSFIVTRSYHSFFHYHKKPRNEFRKHYLMVGVYYESFLHFRVYIFEIMVRW